VDGLTDSEIVWIVFCSVKTNACEDSIGFRVGWLIDELRFGAELKDMLSGSSS
jgi:hypothetical protein